MKNSHIEWTDHTFNPWLGCERVSAACKNCYIERAAPLRVRGMKLGDPPVRTSASNWKQPLAWNAAYQRAEDFLPGQHDHRPRVFCASLGDWLDDRVPIEWLADLLKLIHDTPNLDWLLLTKRPENWRERLMKALAHEAKIDPVDGWDSVDGLSDFGDWLNEWIGGNATPSNIWLGTTVENQAMADQRIPQLLAIPARIRFLSCEPLLELVDLRLVPWKSANGEMILCRDTIDLRSGALVESRNPGDIDWVICGGESGPKDAIRPMHPAWARSLRDQCQAAAVPFHFKQWGDWLPYTQGDAYLKGFEVASLVMNGPGATGWPVYYVGKRAAGRLLDGREWNEFPQPHVPA